jgi:hypothetical protein
MQAFGHNWRNQKGAGQALGAICAVAMHAGVTVVTPLRGDKISPRRVPGGLPGEDGL